MTFSSISTRSRHQVTVTLSSHCCAQPFLLLTIGWFQMLPKIYEWETLDSTVTVNEGVSGDPWRSQLCLKGILWVMRSLRSLREQLKSFIEFFAVPWGGSRDARGDFLIGRGHQGFQTYFDVSFLVLSPEAVQRILLILPQCGFKETTSKKNVGLPGVFLGPGGLWAVYCASYRGSSGTWGAWYIFDCAPVGLCRNS